MKEKRKRDKDKKKEKKRDKRDKKNKSHKHEKKKKRVESSDEEEEVQWVEVTTEDIEVQEEIKLNEQPNPIVDTNIDNNPPNTESQPKKQREGWLLSVPKRETPRVNPNLEKERLEAERQDSLKYKPTEINPFVSKDKETTSEPVKEAPKTVGDGGAGWRKKLHQNSARQLEKDLQQQQTDSRSAPKYNSDSRNNINNNNNNNESDFYREGKFIDPYGQKQKQQRQIPVVQDTIEENKDVGSNRSRAAELRAKLMGKSTNIPQQQPVRQQKMEVISGLDEFGRKIVLPQGESSSVSRKKKNYVVDGVREKYFEDDDKYTLRDLVEQERLGVNSNQIYAENIMKNVNYKDPKFNDINGDFDDEEFDTRLYDSSTKKLSKEEQQEWLLKKQVQAHNHYSKILSDCRYCYDSKRLPKNLLISLGEKAYLSLPQFGQLVPGHCYIAPLQHISSFRLSDEETWNEVKTFQKYLQRMFNDMKLEAVFIETSIISKKQPHAYLECIPLPKKLAIDAPLYFRKEIMDSEKEWSDNKKLIDISKKGFHGSIPDNFSYFFVCFGDGSGKGSGFVHVIENDKKWKRDFGRDIICGMLDLPYGAHIRKRKLNLQEQTSQVKEFLKLWQPYDWTQFLDGGDYVEDDIKK